MTKEELKGIIREIVIEAVRDAMTVELTLEKVRDERTGQPLAVVERKQERVFIPALIAQLVPYHEGAFRGLQQDIGHVKRSLDVANAIFKQLADAVERQSLIINDTQKMLEDESNR